MKAFFKDNDKIIINSMDYTETLVGKAFLSNLKDKTLKVEQRNDINDEIDGLVISIINNPDPKPEPGPRPHPTPCTSPISISVMTNNSTDGILKLSIDTDMILIDYHEGPFGLFVNWLYEHGCEDTMLCIKDNIILGKIEKPIIGKYELPEGVFIFHRPGSNDIITNEKTIIDFFEV